ncbi:MAG: phage Gp37/Gp68 family protein [Chloroflexota bacterium]|nr:phage Gp37/Gp68 family protein [Chloroflexota bacterium]
MGQKSAIEWTDNTFNPWWGCTKVSPGCVHCYAETFSSRYKYDVFGPRKPRRTFGESYWQEPLKWNRQAQQIGRRARVFCASMADVFEDNPSIETERAKLWNLIAETPMLDWLLLTKRPQNMLRFAPWGAEWPPNVWAMTSVENQEQGEKRIPILLEVPAIVRGLSIEPLIGPVDLTPWLKGIQWVIVGGESGQGARQMQVDWVVSLRNQCAEACVPFFFKQWGEWMYFESTSVDGAEPQPMMKRVGKKAAGRELEGRTWDEIPDVEALLAARTVQS